LFIVVLCDSVNCTAWSWLAWETGRDGDV